MDIDAFSLIVQIVLFLSSAFVLPWIVKPTFLGIFRYTFYVALLWAAFTAIVTFAADSFAGSTLGIGFLFLGAFSWLIGFVFLLGSFRKKKTGR